MNEMMQQCCGNNGKPDFDKMKQFMQKCGKGDFSGAEIEQMQKFCEQAGMPDMGKMMQMMESCGCNVPESAKSE